MLRLAALVPLALVACVDTGDEGMYIVNNTAVTGMSCALSGDIGQPQLGRGLIHYESSFPYVFTPLIRNRLQKTDDNVDDVTKTIQLRGADVRLTLKAYTVERGTEFTTMRPDVQIDAFHTLFSGSIPPSSTVNAFVDLIPPSALRQVAAMTGADLTMDAFNADVLAEIVVKGELGDGTIETEPYFYPVTVCNECVVVSYGGCPIARNEVNRGNPCNPYQDGTVDCCVDQANRLICPGPKSDI